MKLTFCVACGSKKDLQHHHLVTKAEGGSDDEANLITLCYDCHLKLHERQRNGAYNASKHIRAGVARAKDAGKRIGRPPIGAMLEAHIQAALAAPGRPGVRKIAKQFGVNVSTVQRISRPT